MSVDAQHDLSAYVLHLIDDHLEAMQGIRERMRPGGRADPGGRRRVALESVSLAERYASSLATALDASFAGAVPAPASGPYPTKMQNGWPAGSA